MTNASAVGYLDSSDEFVPVSLTQGQRDVLQQSNVNPIANIPNRGLVVFGQKTRQATSSALDRVNVARLVNYVRYQADQLAQPFLFEPNDTVTRGAVKDAFDAFLAELVTLRGLNDFLVVVDESNNTPARIDNNELWIDIAIQPIKSVGVHLYPNSYPEHRRRFELVRKDPQQEKCLARRGIFLGLKIYFLKVINKCVLELFTGEHYKWQI